MEILLAQHSGFCFGVKRAIQMALDAAGKEHPIYTLGPLIHSPQMVEELAERGIKLVDKPEKLHDSIVIIRSHGITLSDRKTLIRNGNTLIDATCPFVSKAQEYIRLLCAAGYPVMLMGDKNHPEVVAMLSYCSGETYVVSNPDELPDKLWQKLGVISQTTKHMETLQELVSRLVPRVKELRLFNTICTATSVRQEATVALAQKCDLMIVIGGRNSSNTKMLASLCSGITETLHVETADEIGAEHISSRQKIGLTAGASTPDYLIVEVYNKMNQLTGNRTTVNSVENIPVHKEESC
ncbi:MAG: 4-hydroxy-3-methylbut-2-enyl diphosphate reductase [Candidatus Cloacimonadaceae bacterium]